MEIGCVDRVSEGDVGENETARRGYGERASEKEEVFFLLLPRGRLRLGFSFEEIEQAVVLRLLCLSDTRAALSVMCVRPDIGFGAIGLHAGS
jgi:hypothetical protein